MLPSTQEVAPVSDEDKALEEGTSINEVKQSKEECGGDGNPKCGPNMYVIIAALIVAIGLAFGLGFGLSSKNDDKSPTLATDNKLNDAGSEDEDCLYLPVEVNISCSSATGVDCIEAEEVMELEECEKPRVYEFSIENIAEEGCTEINEWIANIHGEEHDLLPEMSLGDHTICPGEQLSVQDTVVTDLCLGTQYLTWVQVNSSSTDVAHGRCSMLDKSFYTDTPKATCDLEVAISCLDATGIECQEETSCLGPDSCASVVRNVGPVCTTITEWAIEVVSGFQVIKTTDLLGLTEGRIVCPGESISVDNLSYSDLAEDSFTVTAIVAAAPPAGTPCVGESSMTGESLIVHSFPPPAQPDYFMDKFIDSIFVVMTHNSLALPERVFAYNQNHGLARQFRDGIRGFNLDLYEAADGSITTNHGVGLTEAIQYDPTDQVQDLISELSQFPNEFILVQLQNGLETAAAVEKVCDWWGDLLIKNFDPDTPLADYINAGQRVLMVSGGGPLIDPSIGMHETGDIIVENQYAWMNPCTSTPPLGYRRGPDQGRSCKMLNMFAGIPAGDPIRSRVANDVRTALSNIGEFVKQSYADNMINVVLVDFYDVGLKSILQVQHVMRNADENGLESGQECITPADDPDAQCKGDLQCCVNGTCCDNSNPVQSTEQVDCTFDDPTFSGYLERLTNNPGLLELLNDEIQRGLHAAISELDMNVDFPIWRDLIDMGVCRLGMHVNGRLTTIRNLDENFSLKGVRVTDTSGTDLSIMKAAIDAEIDFELKPTFVGGRLRGAGDCGPVDVTISGSIGGYFMSTATLSFTLIADLCLQGADLQFEDVNVRLDPSVDRLDINPSLNCDFPWYLWTYEFVCDNVYDLLLDGIADAIVLTDLSDAIGNAIIDSIDLESPIKDAIVAVLTEALNEDGTRTCPIPDLLPNPCIDSTTELGAYGYLFGSIGCHAGTSFVLCAPADFELGWINGSTDDYLDSSQYNACCDNTPQAQLTYDGDILHYYGLNGQSYKQMSLKCA